MPYIPNIIYIYRKFLNSFNLGKIKIWQDTDGNNEIQGKGFEIMPMVLFRMGNINGADINAIKTRDENYSSSSKPSRVINRSLWKMLN